MSPTRVHLAAQLAPRFLPRLLSVTLVLILADLGAGPASAQSELFAGWDELLDRSYQFDPDEQSLLGFSVRASIDARSSLDAAERFLAQGNVKDAAERWLDVVRRDGKVVMQVAEGDDRWNSRWVGAGEWALFQLISRIPESQRSQLLSVQEQAELTRAMVWRDAQSLMRLALLREGLPSELPALSLLARLQIEEGRFEAARVTLERLQRMGGEQQAQRCLAVLPPPRTRHHEPFPIREGLSLESSWPREAGDDAYQTVLARLADRDRSWINPFTGSPGTFEAPYAPIVPLIEDGVVYLCDSLSIWALDLLSGRRLWQHKGPLEIVDEQSPFSDAFPVGVYANYSRPKAINPHQLAEPLIVGERLFATVQIAERRYHLDDFDGYPINHPLPRRRLRALDRVSGELLWSQERPSLPADAFVNRFDVDGPVVAEGGAVFAAGSVTEGAINAYLAAFDLETGELLWRTPICSGQQELTMFNRPFQEHVISPPTLHQGSLYVCTNLGVIGCVDSWSGRVRWLAAYESIQRRSSRMVRPMNSRDVYWLNQPPLIIGDTLVVAPLDSGWAQGLDRRSGRRLFELSTQMSASLRPPLRHQLLDVGSGRFAVVTDEEVECFDARTGRLEWMSRPFGPYQVLSGAATVDGAQLLVPAAPQLIALDLTDGRPLAAATLPSMAPGQQIQRVVAEGPALVLNDGAAVFAHIDRQAVSRRALADLDHDPGAALALGELALADQDHAGAMARFEEVLAADPPRDLAARAASGRMEAALRGARALDTAEAWSRVLEVADSPGERFLHAEPVLKALQRLGAEQELVHWLSLLAEEDPRRPLRLDDDGELPVALQYSLHRLPFESPARQVALLQELVQSEQTLLWDGLPLAETASRRLAQLLVTHGRSLYEPFELQAEALLAEGASLEQLEARYPNSQLLASRRLELLEQWLASGLQREVFGSARDLSNPAMVALCARAARALGENAYAQALEGSASPARVELPSLPRDAAGMYRLVVSERDGLQLHHPSGSAAPEFAGAVLLSVRGTGTFLLLDTRTGQILWQDRPLPGGVGEGSHSLDFHLAGELLIVRGGSSLAAFRLADGGLVWERSSSGRIHEVLSLAGLIVSLSENKGRYRVEGRGLASGTRAFSVELPSVESVSVEAVGQLLVCLTTASFDRTGRGRGKRLLVIDPLGGTVQSSTAVDSGLSLAASSSEPAVLLLSERVGQGSRLTAFRPDSAEWLWEYPIEGISGTSQRLFPSAPDRLALRLPSPSSSAQHNSRGGDEIVSIDALRGALGSPLDHPRLKVIDPSSRYAPRIVLVDPEDPTRLDVLDGADPRQGYSLDLAAPLSLSPIALYHGRDGFLLISSPYRSPLTTVVVVRGERGSETFTVQIDDADQRGSYQIELVEGAAVLASGGTLRVLRSSSP